MKHPDPNATIQLDRVDRLDDIQLDDLDAPANPAAAHSGSGTKSNAPRLSGRPLTSSGPPPLPPGASLPPGVSYAPLPAATSYAPLPARDLASRAEKKPARKRKTVVQAVLFVALLGAAIVGGLKMGSSLRAAPPAKVAAPIIVPTTPPPAASVAAPPAPAVITMPTIEMSDTPAESK